MWDATKHRISEPDPLDAKFLDANARAKMTKLELFGYHTYGGYHAFFRPDVTEVIGLLQGEKRTSVVPWVPCSEFQAGIAFASRRDTSKRLRRPGALPPDPQIRNVANLLALLQTRFTCSVD